MRSCATSFRLFCCYAFVLYVSALFSVVIATRSFLGVVSDKMFTAYSYML